MGISIRDPEVGDLARELADLRKTNMTEAIAHALAGANLSASAKSGRWRSGWRNLRGNGRMAGPNPAAGYEGRNRRPLGTVIFVDTSAFVAILANESDSDRFIAAIEAATTRITSPRRSS